MADFKRDLLFYAGINTYTGSMYNIGNITMLGNGSYLQQLDVQQLTVTGNAVIPGIQFDSLTVAGNVVSGGNFIGNGALMTGVTSTLPTQASLDIVGNVTAPGNVAAQYFIGNGSALTGLLSSLPATAKIDITGNVTAPGNVAVAGQVNVAGNVAGNYFIGNGALLSGLLTKLPPTANIDIVGNVTAPGDILVTGQVIASGNVQAQYFKGNGAFLTGITGVIAVLPATANIDIRGNVTAPGNVIVAGQVNAVGNVAGNYFIGNGALLSGVLTKLPATANIDIVGNVTSPGDILVTGQVLAVGNVQASYFKGNGAFLTGLTGVVAVLPRTANIDIIGNVTAPGNITVAGQVNVIGNVQGNYFLGNGALLSGVLTKLPATANINIVGNVTAPGDILVTGQVLAVGNVQAQYFKGNGAFLTGLTGVISNLPATANIDITGNVTAPGNITVAGQVNVAGNVSGRFFLGNGSLLTGLTANAGMTFTEAATSITTSNLILTTNRYLSIRASNNTTLNITAAGVNTGGNLLAIATSGFIAQSHLAGYLIVPQGYVANTQARLAIAGGNAPVGSIVTQTDTGNTYLLASVPSSNPVNWLGFDGGNFPVNSVFGRVGDVTAQLGDYTDNLITLAQPIGTVAAGKSVANALASLQTNKANIIGGNISANYFIGNGSLLTGLVGVLGALPAKANIDIIGNVTAPGNIAVAGQVNVVGNVQAKFFIGNGSRLTGVTSTLPRTANIDIRGNVTATGTVTVGGQVSVVGNAQASFFFGNARFLTGVPVAPIPSKANIDIIGNVTAPGNIICARDAFISGNVTGRYIYGNGALLTGISIDKVTTGGNLTANLTTLNGARIFTQQMPFMWNAPLFGSPIQIQNAGYARNIVVAVNQGTASSGFINDQNGWKFTNANEGAGLIDTLGWNVRFDYNKDFIVTFSTYISALSGSMWISVGGLNNGNGITPDLLANDALTAILNYDINTAVTYLNGNALSTVVGTHSSPALWQDYSLSIRSVFGKRYITLSCTSLGTVETSALVTTWRPFGGWLVIGAASGTVPADLYLNNVNLQYL